VKKIKPQTVHARQVQQFLDDAQKRARAAQANDAFYDIAMVSETEANEAVLTAEEYLQSVAADIHARLL